MRASTYTNMTNKVNLFRDQKPAPLDDAVHEEVRWEVRWDAYARRSGPPFRFIIKTPISVRAMNARLISGGNEYKRVAREKWCKTPLDLMSFNSVLDGKVDLPDVKGGCRSCLCSSHSIDASNL